MTSFATHPWLNALLGDPEVYAELNGPALLERMRRVETAHARAMGAIGALPAARAEEAAQRIQNAEIDVDMLNTATAKDGVAVPGLVAQFRAGAPEDLAAVMHRGLTSQDVHDTALVLAVLAVLEIFETRLDALGDGFTRLGEAHGHRDMTGFTRMQPALPISVSHRIDAWDGPLRHLNRNLALLKDRLAVIQVGGPVGDRVPRGVALTDLAAHMARDLNLRDPGQAWHTDRAPIADLGHWLARVCGALGKFGQDVAQMAALGGEIDLRTGGASSSMPHKSNPVPAEVLEALARYASVQQGGLLQALVHGQERSGAAWMLEWLILPDLLETTGRALLTAIQLAGQIERLGHVS